MNRNQKRELERKQKRLSIWLKSLSKEQIELIESVSRQQSKDDLLIYGMAYEMVLRPYLNKIYTSDESEKELKKIFNQVELEGRKVKEFNQRGENYMEKIDQEKDNIIKTYEELIKSGKKHTAAMDELIIKYSEFTVNALRNVITKYKKEIKDEVKKMNKEYKEIESKKTEEEKEIADALEYIFEEPKKEDTATIKKENTEDKNITGGPLPKLKIKTAIIQGEYGEYTIEENTIKVGEEIFKDLTEVTQYEEKEIEKFKKKIEEIRNVFKML